MHINPELTKVTCKYCGAQLIVDDAEVEEKTVTKLSLEIRNKLYDFQDELDSIKMLIVVSIIVLVGGIILESLSLWPYLLPVGIVLLIVNIVRFAIVKIRLKEFRETVVDEEE
jgi:hypothetical protein